MLLPRMLFVIGFIAIVAISVEDAVAFPNKPTSGFGSRVGDSNLLLAFFPDQATCASGGNFTDYGTGGRTWNRKNSTFSSCPGLVQDGTTYLAGREGVTTGGPTTINPTTVSNGGDLALTAGAVGTTIASYFNPPTPAAVGMLAFSFEAWFTLESTPIVGDNYIFQIGSKSATTTQSVETDWKFRLYYQVSGGSPTGYLLRLEYAGLDASQNLVTISTGIQTTPSPSPARVVPTVSSLGLAGKVNSTFFLAISVNSTTPTSLAFQWHFAEAGAASTTNTSYSIAPTPATYGIEMDPVNDWIRLGSSNVIGSSAAQGYPATWHWFSLYSRALSTSEISNHFSSGLPNSNPVVRTTYVWSVLEDTRSLVDLWDTSSWADFENNIPTKMWIESLPLTGTLYINGAALNTTHVPITSATNLTFQQTTPNLFSTNFVTTTCPTPFATFSYTAEDMCSSDTDISGSAACVSPVQGVVNLCVVQVNDPPVPVNLNLTLRFGETNKIVLNAVDPDDATTALSADPSHSRSIGEVPISGLFINATGAYQTNSSINLTSSTVGLYGYLTYHNGSACTSTSVPSNTWLPPLNNTFGYCYLPDLNTPSSTFNRSVIGIESFSFIFRDSASLPSPSPATLQITVLNPLSTCSPSPPTPSISFVNNEACHTRGPTVSVPVFLSGVNYLPASPIQYRITTLPAFGKLYYATDSAGTLGAEVKANDLAPLNTSTLSPTSAQVFYVPFPYYFNEIKYTSPPSFGYTNLANASLDPCLAQNLPSCPCPSAATGGCPDTFKFTAKVVGKNIESEPGTYSLNVDATLTPPVAVVAPARVTIATGKRFTFTNESAITIVDNDNDVYYMGLMVTTSRGVLTVHTGPDGFQGANDEDFSLDACQEALETPGCKTLKVRSYPSKLNRFLQYLTLYSATAFSNSSDAQEQLLIYLFKPSPNGFDSNSDNYLLAPSLTKVIVLAPLDADTTSPQDNGLSIAIIAGGAAVGFIALICCINVVVWFISKSRKAAKLARRSMRSVSTSSHKLSIRTQALEEEEEEEEEEERGQRKSKVCCCGAKEERRSGDSVNTTSIDVEEGARTSAASRIESPSRGRSETAGTAASTPPRSTATTATTAITTSSPSSTTTTRRSGEAGAEEEDDDSIFFWEKHIDRNTGDAYYFNSRTGRSQWEQPIFRATRRGK